MLQVDDVKPEKTLQKRFVYSESNFMHAEWTHRTRIINHVISRIRAVSYLEIGLGDGVNFESIRCPQKWSVDPAERPSTTARPTHRMTSDAFFWTNQEKFDVIFIDGLHHSDQIWRDLSNAIEALRPGGVVVCHDLNPTSEAMQAVPRSLHKPWTGDGWKAWVKLRCERPDLPMVVVDADYGVGLILPGRCPGPALTSFPMSVMTWENFEMHRAAWLHLLGASAAREFVLKRLETTTDTTCVGTSNSSLGSASTIPVAPGSCCSVRQPSATAVLLYGVMHRSLRHVVTNFRKYLLAPLQRKGEVDIFFHSWNISTVTSPRAGEHGIAVECDEVERWLPEARGIFESQDDFDSTVNWEPWFGRNSMRHITKDDHAAQVTLMNFRRALESQQRAWSYFECTKRRKYTRVVATRPDLLFLHELAVPVELEAGSHEQSLEKDETCQLSRPGEKCLWIPRFESWGGVNDRFAMGREREIAVWCNRAAFADGWLLKAGNAPSENPEWLLMQWLERNRIKPHLIDLKFQRIRANGVTAEGDLRYSPSGPTSI